MHKPPNNFSSPRTNPSIFSRYPYTCDSLLDQIFVSTGPKILNWGFHLFMLEQQREVTQKYEWRDWKGLNPSLSVSSLYFYI